MKFKHFLLAAFAMAAVVISSCKKEDETEEGLTLSQEEVTLPKDGGSVDVTINSSEAWTISKSANSEWLSVSETSGASGKKVITLHAEANTSYDRNAKLTVKAGFYSSAIKVSQPGAAGEFVLEDGEGTKDKPFSVAKAVEEAKKLTYTDSKNYDKGGPYYIRGKVSTISKEYNWQYGTAQFKISDYGNASDAAQFDCYNVKFLGNKAWEEGNAQIAAGKEVIIYGQIMNYSSTTPETVSGSYIYALDGKTEDTNGHEPAIAATAEAKTVTEFIEAASSSVVYKVTGTVTKVNATYGNVDITDGTNTVQIYGAVNWDKWKDKVAANSVVTALGSYKKYENNGKVTHELIGIILNSEGGDVIDYENAPAKTIAEFISAADTKNFYKLTGTVSGNINAQYGNFDLTDATGTIVVYGASNWNDWKDKVLPGSTVVLAAQYQLYQKEGQADKHEAVNARILSCEGGSAPQESEPKGSGTLEDPYNAAKALEVATALEPGAKTESDVYVSGKIASIKYTFSAQYGTATFDISDDGTTAVTQFTCYSVYYLGNRAWVDGDAQVKVGDDVVICGKLVNYKDEKTGNTTPETASKEAWIYSLNGETSIEQSPVFGVASQNVNVAGSATSAVVKVIGNVAWTAASTDATVAPEAGQGAGEITVTFDANTDTENAKTYTVVVSTEAEVETKSFTVTINQAKASTGNETVVTVTKEQLAAAACNSAKVVVDEVISFTNSTDYGSNTVTELRIYKNKTLTISADGATITNIEFTCTKEGTTKEGPGCFGAGAPEGYSYEGKVGTWAGSAASVAFTATDNQVRIVELKVTYTM